MPFSFLFQRFLGFHEEKNPCFFSGFPLLFSKKQTLGGPGGFANEIAKISFSLRKFLANGPLRQNLLAIANAMAWRTQSGTAVQMGGVLQGSQFFKA